MRAWKGARCPSASGRWGSIRARNCYYVDKTPHVLRLLEEGTHYFLSRPRRFGKSLPVDTLKELFEGNGELFRGLRKQWIVAGRTCL